MSTIYRKPIRWRSTLGTVIGDPAIDPTPRKRKRDRPPAFRTICSDCREYIPEARLKAMPHTHRCASCQAKFERKTSTVRRLQTDEGIAGSREDCKRMQAKQWSEMVHRSIGNQEARGSTNSVKRSATAESVIQTRRFSIAKYGSITQRIAAQRRKSATAAEAELERILNELNDGVLRGKFIREWAFGGQWIIDFFFNEIRLGIEVDGTSHKLPAQMILDRMKELECKKLDITLIRVTNREVFGNRSELIQKLRDGWKQANLAKKQRIQESSCEADEEVTDRNWYRKIKPNHR